MCKGIESSSSVSEAETTNLIENEHNNTQEEEIQHRAPKDRWNFIYLIFYFLGTASLMHWNFFITADSYWRFKFRNTSIPGSGRPEERTHLQTVFFSYLSIASMIPNLLCSILNSLIVHKIHAFVRGGVSVVVVTIVLVITTVLVMVDTDSWQDNFLVLTLVLVVLINMFASVFIAVLYGLAGRLPSRYVSAVASGQALGGLIPTMVRILAISINTTPEYEALFYFLFADISLIAAMASFVIVTQSRLVHFYLRKEGIRSLSIDERWENIAEDQPTQLTNIGGVIKKILVFALSIVFTLFVTLSVFPALCVNIVSVNFNPKVPILSSYFVPVFCFFIFNLGDYIGRVAAGYIKKPHPRRRLYVLGASILRFAFIPLFVYCNAQPRNHLPVVFHSDVYYIVFMCLFAVTNGYIMGLSFMHGPSLVEPQEQEVSGAILSASATAGTLPGSLLSTAVVRVP